MLASFSSFMQLTSIIWKKQSILSLCCVGQVQVVCVGQVQVMCVGSSTSKDDVTVLSCSEGGSPTDDLTMCGCKLVMLASFSSFMQLTSIIWKKQSILSLCCVGQVQVVCVGQVQVMCVGSSTSRVWVKYKSCVGQVQVMQASNSFIQLSTVYSACVAWVKYKLLIALSN